MKTRKINPLAIVAAALVLVAAAGLLIWFFTANIIVGWHAYPKNAEILNLRGKELTVKEYDSIREKLPDCELYWDVPFQGGAYPENTETLTVTSLADEDVDVIGYFRELRAINAQGCTDYPQLAEVRSRYPEVALSYDVTINGTAYAQDTTELVLTGLTDEEIDLIQYLPELTMVQAGQVGDYAQVEKLQAAYPQLTVACTVTLGGQEFTSETTDLTATGVTSEEAVYLGYLPQLKSAHLVNPEMPAAELFALQSAYPEIAITWEVDVFGTAIRNDATEAEISGATVDAAKLGELTDYLPDLETLFLNECTVDNDAMAALREEKRSQFKLIWTVDCGGIITRTDATYFMPLKHSVYYFFDEDTYNLRYCEDMICIDLGHMSIHNADFVEFMPNLKYLILAHTQIADITPLQHCKNLVFLELDWSIVKDYTPLLGCTALEDLNLSKTYADVTPLLEMTWLKHLWITDRSVETQIKLNETFEETETELYLNGFYTVGGGWRQLPNYYAMRDILGMPYMD